MSQQGPILVISDHGRPSFAAALDEAGMFPVIDADWSNAVRAVADVKPAAVVADMPGVDEARVEALAQQIGRRKPYLPLIAVEPEGALPENALPLSLHDGNHDRLSLRLRAARFGRLPSPSKKQCRCQGARRCTRGTHRERHVIPRVERDDGR